MAIDIIDAVIESLVKQDDLLKSAKPKNIHSILFNLEQSKRKDLDPESRMAHLKRVNDLLGIKKSRVPKVKSETQPKETVKRAVNLVDKLVGDKKHDEAHKVFSSIPKNHIPKELADYNPHYTHMNITPSMWKNFNKGFRQHTHDFYNELVSGAHDTNPQLKGMADTFKALKNPKKT